MKKVNEIVIISVLSVIIMSAGLFKLPNIVPGTELQLSAPNAIAIAVNFGFKRYFYAGGIAGILLFILGINNIFNFFIASISES